MKKYIVFLMVFVCFSSIAQTSKPIVQIKDMGGSIRFTHNNGTFTEIPKSSIGAVLSFTASTSIQVTVLSEGSVDRILGINYLQLTSPIVTSTTQLIDTISAFLKSTASSPLPIPLIVDNIGIDTVRVIDSVRVWFERNLDTSNQGILNNINATLNDSIRVYFADKAFISDTANQGVLNSIFNLLLDSLDKQLYVLNPYIDSAIVRRMDTIIDRLTTTEKLDTLKGLVYTASAKVRTNRDTLFNCKSISFGRKNGASGTLILTFENGESESFNVANDDLPAWVNGEFISYLDYNATGTVGLIVNTLGCSQTDTEICAKVKPIFDCDLVIPITCLGWQSASGVWQTLSGCWNTGQ
jgi:hypothetical protein